MSYFPQLILTGLLVFGLGVSLALDGTPTRHSFAITLARFAIVLALLWWGGFYDGVMAYFSR